MTPWISMVMALGLNIGTSRADNTWDGGAGGSYLWSNAANWGLDTAPGYGTLVFSGTVGTTNVLDGNFTATANTNMNQVNWNGASAWVMNSSGGAVLNLFDSAGTQAKLESLGTGGVTINAPINFAATTGAAWAEINAVGSNMTFGSTGTINVSGSAVNELRFYGSGKTVTINSVVTAGSKKLVIGPGVTDNNTIILNGANSYTGNTEVNVGTVQLGNNSGAGTGTIYFGNGGTTFANLSGAVLLNTGGLTVSNGIVTNKADTGSAVGTGTRTIGGTFTTGTSTYSGGIVLNGGAVLTAATGGTVAFSGVISNGADTGNVSRALTISGTGSVVLSGANTYTGLTSVNSGELQVSNNSALGATAGATSVASGARLVLNTGVTVTGETITVAGDGGNFTGGLQAAAGGTATWAGPISLGAGARLGAGAAGTLTVSGVIASGAGSDLIISGTAGTGAVVLSGANTYSGLTSIVRGKLVLGAAGALPATTTLDVHSATTPDAATFDLSGFSQTIAALQRTDASGTATVTNSGAAATLTINQTATTTYGGLITGAVALTKSGTGSLTLTGVNTHTGATAVNAGSLVATISTTQNSLGAGAASVATGATLTLNNTNVTATTPTISNTFTGAGLLKLVFAANATARNTTMNNVTGFNGTIQLSNAGATGDKWTIGGITVPGSLLIDSGSQLNVSVGTNAFTGGINVIGTGNNETRGAIRLIGTLGGNVTLAGDATIGSEGGTMTGAISSGLAGTQTLTIGSTNSTGNATLSGIIGGGAGTIALTKVAAGALTLSGANTFAGATTISAGSVVLGNATALGTTAAGTTVAAGAVLDLAGQAVGAEAVTINGTGISSGGALINSSATAASLSGTLTLGSASSIGGAGAGPMSLTGVVSGAFALTKVGTGTVIFNAANTFTGGLTISAGTAAISAAGNTGTAGGNVAGFGTGAVTLNTGGTAWIHGNGATFGTVANAWNWAGGALHIEDGITTFSGNVNASAATTVTGRWGDVETFSGIISGAGALTFGRSASGTTEFPIFLLSGVNTTTGAITAGANATVQLGNVAALGATTAGTTVASGGVLDLNGLAIGAEGLTLNGTGISSGGALINSSATAASLSGAITLGSNSSVGGAGAGAMSLTGIISGGFGITKVGAGTTILSGVNTYTGVTTLSAGVLRATTSVQALGTGAATLTLSGGTLQLANDTGLNFARNTTVTANTTISSDRLVAGAAVTHTLGTLSIGAQTLSVTRGANATSATGVVTFGATTLTGNATFAPAANAQLNLGAVGGAFSLAHNGAGITVLTAAGTYTGTTSVNGGGTLRVTSSGGLGSSTAINVGPGIALNGSTNFELQNNITLGSGKTLTLTTATGGLRSNFLSGSGNNTWQGNVVLAGPDFAMIQAASGSSLTISGNLTSTGAAGTGTMAVRGSGTVVLNGNINFGTDRNFSHTDAGTVIVNSTGNLWKETQISNGQMQVGINNALATGVDLVLGQNTAGDGRLELNGFNQAVAGLRTFATSTGSHIIRNSNLATPSILTFTTAAATTDIVKNVAVQGSSTTVGVTGALHMVKEGTGRAEFELGLVDANSWTVNAGTLAFTGTTSRTLAGDLTGAVGATVDKTGASVLTATGTWNNAGTTTVSAGSLVLGNGTSGTISVADGATLVTGYKGGVLNATSLTFGTAGASTFSPTLTTAGAAAGVNVGTLTTSGTTVSVVPGGAVAGVGTYPLIDYTSIAGNGFGGFALGAVGTYPHMTASLVDNTVDGRVDLSVTAIDTLIWTGATSAAWDVNTTANFKLASNGSASTFYPSDSVLFDDTGANKTITATGTPAIGSLTFNNSTGNDYSVAGVLTGSGNITKNNTGTVTLSGANTYTGVTNVTNGVLLLSGANTLKSAVNVTGGTLKIGNSDALRGAPVVNVSGGGTFDANGIGVGTRYPEIAFSGSGVGGNGAIVNNGVGITNNSHFAKYTMTGDATWGGSGRYDLVAGQTFNGGSFTLTKVGAGELWYNPNAGSILENVVVNGGFFGSQGNNPLSATATVTVNNGGTHQFYSAITGQHKVVLNDGGTFRSSNATPTLTGTVTLNGTTTNRFLGAITGTTLNLAGQVTGTGGFTKNDAGTVQLQNATNNYAGDTNLAAGTLHFNATGVIPTTTNLIFTGGTLDPANRTHNVASISGASGSINQGTAGTGILISNQTSTTTYGGTVNRVTLRMAGSGALTLNGTAVSTSPNFEANAGVLTLAGTADNSAGTATVNNGGTLVLAKTAADLTAHAVGTALTINSGGVVKLGGSVTALTGTLINLAPVGAPANYVDQIYNASAFTINTGGTFDLAGMSEAVNTIAGTGGTITNSVAATTSKLYVGHQNGNTTYAGIIQDGTGTVALEKIGTGSLTLTGTNTYTGATVLTAGSLTVPSGASLGNTPITLTAGTFTVDGTTGTGAITQNGGTLTGAGTLGGTLTTASGGIITIGTASNGATAATLTAGGLTFSGGAIINADFTGTVLDKIALGSGALNLSGTNTVNVALGGAGWVTGVYPLISYGTLASGGVANFTLGTAAGHNVVNFTDVGGAINLDVTAGTVKWNGNVSAVWDNNNIANWQSTDSKYLNGDNVVFDDTAAGPSFNPTVTTANVTPASVTFNNSTNAYTLSGGTLGIAGSGQLFKQGTNTVTLTNANSYTGATNVQNGTLVANYNSGTATTVLAAASTINVSSGATFRAIANDAAFTLANAITGAGTVELNPHATGATGPLNVGLTGANSGFSGTLRLLAPFAGASPTYRVAPSGPAALGTATIDVKSGAQLILAAGTYANNITIAGTGYADTSGNIGALRMEGSTWTGNVVVDAVGARIGAHGGTGIISGSISGGNLSVNATNYNTTNYTMIFTGANSYGTTTIGGAATAGTGTNTMRLNIGTNGTTGTLGAGNVIINGDGMNGLLAFDRSDGYTLATGQTITGAGTSIGRTFIEFDTQGTGFSSNGNAITLGTAATGGTFRVGQNRANTVTNINGSLTGAGLTVGSGAAGTGATLNLNSGANVSVGNFAVAAAATGAVVNIAAGSTVNSTGNFFVGEQVGWSGTVNQTGGDVTAGGHFRLGHWGSNTSAYNISGGTLTAANINSATDPAGGGEQNGGIYLGIDGTGTMTQSNSTVTTDFIVLDNRGDTGAGTNMPDGIDRYTLNSGTLVFRSQWGLTQRNATTAVTLAGGTIRNGGTNLQVRMDTAPDISGALTLDTVSAGNSFNWLRNLTGAGSVTLSGGGTMKFTTTGTQTVSVPISGTGAVEKLGTGTTTLSGTNTYNGATTITAGRLNLTGSANNSALTMASGTLLGGEGSAGSFTFNGGTIIIDPNTVGALTATGALTTTGTNLVDFTSLPTGLGPFTIVNYGTTFTGTTSNFALATPANFRSPTFADTGSGVGPAAITLNFATADLIWTGTGGNTWNIATTTNWNDTTPAASAFYTGDRITLDDSAPGSATSITLAGSLQPGALTVNSSAGGNNYTLTASAGNVITGGTSLLKTGTSTLTMAGNVANTYTGGTTIAQGAVNLQHIQSLGTGTITLNNATTGSNNTSLYLDTNRPAASTYVSNITIANQGTGTSTLGSRANVGSTGVMGFQNITLAKDVTFDSNAADRTDYNNISGTGNVTIVGAGRSVFVTANTWVGDLIVNTTGAGSLQIGTATAPTNAIPDTANVTVNSGAVLNLSVSGNESINGLNGAGIVGINQANSTLTVGANNGSGSFSGVLQGSGANTLTLVKAGTATQIISGANTYGGTTSISGGILQVGAGGASGQLGTGAVSLATGTSLNYLRTGSVAQTGALNSATAGAGTLNLDGGAVLTLNAGGNFSGTVNVLNGSLVAGATNVWATGASAPAVNLSPGTSLTNTGNSNLVHLGNVSMNGATITTGTGIGSTDGENYLLNGNVTVTGTAPSLITRDASRTDVNSGFSLNGVRAFDVADVTTSTAADLTVSTELENPASVIGSLTKTGLGTIVLANNNTYTGNTTVSAGTLQVGNAGTTGSFGTGNVVNDASVVFNRTNALSVANVISGIGSVDQAGIGTTTFTSAQTYTGGTTVSNGTLALTGAGALADAGAVNISGATAVFNISGITASSETIGSLTGASGSSVVLGSKTLVTGGNNASTTLAGVISGTGGLTKLGSGSQTITAAQTYTGPTSVNGGSLILTGSAALADTSAVNLAASTVFDIAGITATSETVGSLSGVSTSSVVLGDRSLIFGMDNTNTTFSGVASGTDGSLTKVGTGTTTISGANTYTGNTNINGGTLLMASSNTLPDTAALNLSSGGTLSTGGYSDSTGALSVTNTVNFDMGASAGSELTFANVGSWAGLLNVWNYTGAPWTAGTDKLIFTSGGMALDDLHVNFYGGPVGDTASLIGTGGGGLIGNELVPVPEPGAIASLLALFGLAGFKERRRFLHFRK